MSASRSNLVDTLAETVLAVSSFSDGKACTSSSVRRSGVDWPRAANMYTIPSGSAALGGGGGGGGPPAAGAGAGAGGALARAGAGAGAGAALLDAALAFFANSSSSLYNKS